MDELPTANCLFSSVLEQNDNEKNPKLLSVSSGLPKVTTILLSLLFKYIRQS